MTEGEALPPTLRLPGVSAYACDYTPAGNEFTDIFLPPHLASASPKRKAEFRAGRYCAMRALEAMGALPAVPRSDQTGRPFGQTVLSAAFPTVLAMRSQWQPAV